MSKRAEMWAYLQDEARLINYRASTTYTACGGERQRSYAEQQRKYDAGLSKARPGKSQHGKCKATDLDFFDKNGKWLKVPDQNDMIGIEYHKTLIKPYGDYWESLDPKNFWGGNIKGFYDPGHFERRD